MLYIIWQCLVCIYLSGAFLYIIYMPFTPLGAMQYSQAIPLLLITVSVGSAGVLFGYMIFSKIKFSPINILENRSFLYFCSLIYAILGMLVFLIGVRYYGGYISFLHTPYVPIYSSSAENEIKDTLISTSGLLSIFSIVTLLSAAHNYKLSLMSQVLAALSIFILVSIFIQGRRENILLLVMTWLSYRIISGKLSINKILKVVFLSFSLLLIAGAGLHMRESSGASNSNIFEMITMSFLFETHFTVATLANEIFTHTIDRVPFFGFSGLLKPILFMIPSVLFSILGLSKQDFFENTDFQLYDSKGGSFVFSDGFHSFGYIGVFIHGFLLGSLLIRFYISAKRTGLPMYHFPIVSLILVSLRKDITYGIKYISLMFILLFMFYIIFSILPKKVTGRA